MDARDDADKGVRILSFDNGGPGTYSQILILKEYMTRLAMELSVEEDDVYPADYFELMGGVGFGGLTALILGHLRMNIEEATAVLLNVASAIFPSETQSKYDPETNMKKLKGAMEDVLQARGFPLDTKMNDKRHPSVGCKVAVFTATSANLSHPVVFRTYASRRASVNCTIVEAMCATMAVPSLFCPVKIGPRLREQSFVGGPLGANNPTREILKEASLIFGKDRRVAQILSIGSGVPRLLSLDQSITAEGLGRLMENIAFDCDRVAKELYTQLFSVDVYLRLNVDKGMENISMDNWNELGAIESHTSAYVESTAISEALESSLSRLKERIGTITLGQIGHSNSIKAPVKTAPAVSPYFVVRQREWEAMLRYLVDSNTSGQKIFPITGMGGCGKTQMVSYFLQEQNHLFIHVVFVDASSVASTKADLQAWARSCGDGHEQDGWEDALVVLTVGPHNGRWVLVLDNADDPDLDLMPFLPKCYHGTVLITSRNRDIGHLKNTHHLEMGRMDEQEAISALLHAAQRQLPIPPEDLESAYTLVNELGCLALALVQAGTYCHQLSSDFRGVLQPYTFMQYLALFRSQRAELMKRAGPSSLDGYRRGVYTTLDLSYKAVPPNAKGLLHLLSYFHHSDISLTMLATAAENTFKDPCVYLPRPKEHKDVVANLYNVICTEGSWNEFQMQDMIQVLRSFSLVSTTIVTGSLFIQLHPLVQAWARDMIVSDARDYRIMARQVLTSSCATSNPQLVQSLAPHINDIREGAKDGLHVNDQVAIARLLHRQGRYRDAETPLSEALHVLQGVSKEETEDILSITGELAEAVSSQGRFSEAATLKLAVLNKYRTTFGIDNLNTIHAAASLAATYHRLKRWDDAETLELQVLEKLRRTLGMDHPNTMSAITSLAVTRYGQGRLSEAEALEVEVLEHYRKQLGDEHPGTLVAIANLAATYHEQKRWCEAETLKLEVLEKRRRVLGVEHPETILATASLATTYGYQGKWVEAEPLLSLAVECSIKVLGQYHPQTRDVVHWIAYTYRRLDKIDKAEEMDRLTVQTSSIENVDAVL